MSDALALLDWAAARVSSMLMPDGLHTLISFLRGEAWEEIPPSLQIPNVLISFYNYTPLAIAADASLVSLSSSGERSALVQTFERYEFRVFVVNFMPESSSAVEDDIPHKGHSSSNNSHHNSSNTSRHNSGNIIRMKCMESVQAWCDVVYGEETQSVLLEHSHGNINPKRIRYEEGTTNTIHTTNTNNNTMTKRANTQRVLFIIRCCADANSARSGAERSRRSRDPLLLLLHDISATAALCRAREAHTHHTRLRFSVLLLPDDLVYGGTLLEESLKASLVRDYCVRLFRGSTVQMEDAEQSAFLRRLEAWMGAAPTMTVNGIDGNSGNSNSNRKRKWSGRRYSSTVI
ncbi:hypothetical protein LSM04_000524 [Trypanosoma melophagium]|uniref:uncharacterized protein n=1 Tax=Trypanosoma melophagium TaxID=715481 RepID=UPI00351AACBA|nr:hypothetical protein LSM04_000524 [Trypanosoma melophagium]